MSAITVGEYGPYIEFGDANGQAFGHEIATAPHADVKEQITLFQGAVQKLQDSHVAEHRNAVAEINWSYIGESVQDHEVTDSFSQRDSSALEWFATTSFRNVKEFCDKNYEVHAAAVSALDSFSPELIDVTFGAMHNLVDRSYAPRDSIRAMEKTVQRVGKLMVIDHIDQHALGVTGMQWMETNKVAIARDYLLDGSVSESFQTTVTHEYLHALGDYQTAGLFWSPNKEDADASRILEETTVTHAALTGLERLVDPDHFDSLFDKIGSYLQLRELVGFIAEDDVMPQDFMRAFFAPKRFVGMHASLLERVDEKIRSLLPEFETGGSLDFYRQYNALQGKLVQSEWVQDKIFALSGNRGTDLTEDEQPADLSVVVIR